MSSRNDTDKFIEDYIIDNKEKYYRLAYSYVKNSEDALDIIQESIYKAINSSNSLKDLGNVKTWFYRLLVNTSIDFLRKQKKYILADDDIINSYDSGKFDNYKDIDLENALDALPYNYRIIVILRYFEDLKIEEVAEVLNENINTIKTRLYKALKILKLEIQDNE